MSERITHEHLLAIVPRLPTDYTDYGGTVERWSQGDNDMDCSWGCRWAAWLASPFKTDWCVCTNPNGPRKGLLTFEHQAGRGCFETAPHARKTKIEVIEARDDKN